MKAIIYRGTQEIGGTAIELIAGEQRILLDAGYPLFLNGSPIQEHIAKLPAEQLLALGVLPDIKGLYKWDAPGFAGLLISHAHMDHYGLLPYVHPDIPVYLSAGTQKLIELSQLFHIHPQYTINARSFKMYKAFQVGDFTVKPYLMDHSAFDAAAFEIHFGDKTVLYSGDFRGHGRKSVCLDSFLASAPKGADVLFTEGSMLSRQDEKVLTEQELEQCIVEKLKGDTRIALFQASSQNIDRLVSFYRAARKLGRLFVIDVYTANVLAELHALGGNLPYPSSSFEDIKVFFPYRLTQRIFNEIGAARAKRFSPYYISKEQLAKQQGNVVMMVRPSMLSDLQKCNFAGGTFFYSLWQGYRDGDYQQNLERYLSEHGFDLKHLHTSGHAAVSDIKRIVDELNARRIVPVHTMHPDLFLDYSPRVELMEDGKAFMV